MAVGSLLLTALTGKAAGSRPGGPLAAAPPLAPGCRAAGEAVGEAGGLTGFRWGGRGKERGRGGEQGDGGRSVPRTSVAGLGGRRAESGPALGEAGGSHRPSLSPFPSLPCLRRWH